MRSNKQIDEYVIFRGRAVIDSHSLPLKHLVSISRTMSQIPLNTVGKARAGSVQREMSSLTWRWAWWIFVLVWDTGWEHMVGNEYRLRANTPTPWHWYVPYGDFRVIFSWIINKKKIYIILYTIIISYSSFFSLFIANPLFEAVFFVLSVGVGRCKCGQINNIVYIVSGEYNWIGEQGSTPTLYH
jgi:hypothetical protein